ncbi:MAG TPA: ribosome silencing factor [Candidatus Eremiobacteraceae bacterium]|nr:ribosome silencing factor [Candidatus Eremiobacteraceae bacterium]
MKRRIKTPERSAGAVKNVAQAIAAGPRAVAELAPARLGIASTSELVKTLSDRQVTDLAQRCKQAAIEKKADNVVLLDIRGRANFADYFVIATGRSVIQVRAIADGVVEASEVQFGAPIRTEGYNEGSWVLVDYGAVIVHVFTPAAREFYNLERLWAKPTSRKRVEK